MSEMKTLLVKAVPMNNYHVAKVLHVITGLNNGGAEGVLYRLCTYSGVEQHIVVSLTDEGLYGPKLKSAGIEVYALGMPRGRLRVTGLWRLYCLLRQIRPDIAQTWMYHADLLGGVVARLAGIRSVVWGVRSAYLDAHLMSRSTRFVARSCALLSHFIPKIITCCSREGVITHQRLGYSKDKFVFIPNGYDQHYFQQAVREGEQFRHAHNLSDNIPVLGMVARFDPNKDHKNLFRALNIVNKKNVIFQCLLIGPGITHENVQIHSWLSEYSLQGCIHLLGPRSDIPAIMHALDLFVLSSAGEAFPNVLAEAMACGTPCVATDVGDTNLIIGGTGWIVPPNDSFSLADAIIHALLQFKNKQEWLRRQEQCRLRIEQNFSLDVMVHGFKNVWDRCLTKV